MAEMKVTLIKRHPDENGYDVEERLPAVIDVEEIEIEWRGVTYQINTISDCVPFSLATTLDQQKLANKLIREGIEVWHVDLDYVVEIVEQGTSDLAVGLRRR